MHFFFRLFIICCCMTSFSLFARIPYTGKEKVIFNHGFESNNSFISFVTINEHEYIVKQKKDVTKQLLSAVREAVAAFIAQVLDIAHSVTIISAQDDIVGKVNTKLPATLHTIAAGKTVREQPESRYFQLSLKQRSPEDVLTGRWLTESIIDQITWHEQLPIIIALDLFICNTDRHGGNLFYDPATDCFCAIDMDNIFRRDLPGLACQKLDIMINVHKKRFTKEELKALKSVRNTLQFLLKKYTSKQIIAQFHMCAKQVGKVNAIDRKKMEKKNSTS